MIVIFAYWLNCSIAIGWPLRVIQRISGHKTLQALQRYLEVGEEQVESAIAALTF